MEKEFIILYDLSYLTEFEPTELCDVIHCVPVGDSMVMKRFKTLEDAAAYREHLELNGQIIEI